MTAGLCGRRNQAVKIQQREGQMVSIVMFQGLMWLRAAKLICVGRGIDKLQILNLWFTITLLLSRAGRVSVDRL